MCREVGHTGTSKRTVNLLGAAAACMQGPECEQNTNISRVAMATQKKQQQQQHQIYNPAGI